MTSTRRDLRVLTAAGVATVALAALSTVAIAAATGNFRYSRCPEPGLPGHVVDVTLADMGGEMMGRGPMMASLQADPRIVPSGTVSFLAHNHGRLAHEMLVQPDEPATAAAPMTHDWPVVSKCNRWQRAGQPPRSQAALR